MTTTSSSLSGDQAAAKVSARRAITRQLGEWTTANRIDVRVSGGVALLDLLLPRIDANEIHVHLDVDHGVVTLLVPDGSRVVDDELRWTARAHLRDWAGDESPDGKVIRLDGQVRRGQVRIRRGGVALLSLVTHGRAADVRRAHAAGRLAVPGAGR